MHAWRVRQRYGFGAASVALAAEPYLLPDWAIPLDARAGRDFLLTTLPTLALTALVCLLVLGALSLGRVDPTALEVMLIARDVPEPPVPESIPEPEPAPPPQVVQRAPEPPKPLPVQPVQPKPLKAPEPPPAPKPIERIAAAPKPKPPPPPIAEPRPMPKLAVFKAAPLSEPVRDAREVRDRPRSEVARKAIDQPVPVPTAPIPAEREQRSSRFASVRPESTSQVRPPNPAIGAIAAPALEETPRSSRSRSSRNEGPAPARREPQLALAAPAAPGAVMPEKAPATVRRSGTVGPDSRPVRHGAPAALSAPALSAAAPAAPAVLPARAANREVPSGPAADRAANPALAGVPLASLAACVSDREEDALKRRVVAAVTTQQECTSRAGTYRFVEAKNLNAFLMTIERASNRVLADRCAELSNALACLAQPARR